ncbi:biotin--[acetyl-CoA-carboxylase] ligase [Psychrobacter jeotgali]|uniref:biotin--[acetyl-CoA-carboxylase] ligase n=1 Tax=Psychrobacter jeotgali TaxID=179010 RepID=UPI00191842F2|nr:biotin--[acetyl-CoA-carboxylase] ligase [Psychrobacter jeotgali]
MSSFTSLSGPLSSSLFKLNHRHVTSSVSTNSELLEQLNTGELDRNQRHLLTADTQTAGRGQRQRSWQSPLGNVYLSLYHPIQMPVSGLLSLIIGVELAKMPIIETLNKQLSAQQLAPIGVKWANDLGFYQVQKISNDLAEENKIIPFNKLAGILIEPVWQAGKLLGVVMGVGLNVKATPKLTAQTLEGMSYQAISLQDIYEPLNLDQQGLELPSLDNLYQQVSQALIAAMDCFEKIMLEKQHAQRTTEQNDATDKFLHQFDRLDALSELTLQVTQNHGEKTLVVKGEACGIDTNGCLQLRQDNGKISALFTGRIDVIDKAQTTYTTSTI